MILDKKINVRVNGKTLNYYKNLGYDAYSKKYVLVDINDLSLGSEIEINVKCDFCDKERKIKFKEYNKNIKTHGLYSCSQNCSNKKRTITSQQKFGVEHSVQSDKVKEKSKQTKLEKYGNQNYTNREKAEETNLIKYGVINLFELEKTKNYIKNNLLKKYGVTNVSQLVFVKDKKEKTCLKNYGVKYSQQNSVVRERSRLTCQNKYGVDNPQQNEKIFEKTQINGFKMKIHESTGLKYRGTYEKHFLDYCFENSIEVENLKSIRYDMNGKKKVYYPDFYLKDKNLIIEIKSSYYYEKYLEKNLAKQKSCVEQGYNFIFVINKNYKYFISSIL